MKLVFVPTFRETRSKRSGEYRFADKEGLDY